jgi:hypothetical protein
MSLSGEQTWRGPAKNDVNDPKRPSHGRTVPVYFTGELGQE